MENIFILVKEIMQISGIELNNNDYPTIHRYPSTDYHAEGLYYEETNTIEVFYDLEDIEDDYLFRHIVSTVAHEICHAFQKYYDWGCTYDKRFGEIQAYFVGDLVAQNIPVQINKLYKGCWMDYSPFEDTIASKCELFQDPIKEHLIKFGVFSKHELELELPRPLCTTWPLY